MAKRMKKGVDQETRAAFKQLLKTQDPRWRPDNPETQVVPPARWKTVPDLSPGESRLKESVFVRRSEGEGSQTPAAANGFKNREKPFSHFRQDKITGEEQQESEEPGQLCPSGGRTRPIILRRPTQPVRQPITVTPRSRSAPGWCECPGVASNDETSPCSDSLAESARRGATHLVSLRRATEEIRVTPPTYKIEVRSKGPRIDQSVETRREAHWNSWMARYDMGRAFRPITPVEEELEVHEGLLNKENVPPNWEGSINYMEHSKGESSRAVYALGLARAPETGREAALKVMIDPGNVTKKGIVISRDFQKRLGVGFQSLNQGRVGTAGRGKPMKALGMTEPFTLAIKGIERLFLVNATVIEELVDDMNIGTAFLQRVTGMVGEPVSMQFHENGTMLKVGRETVELIKTMEDNRTPTGGTRIRRPEDINGDSEKLEQMVSHEEKYENSLGSTTIPGELTGVICKHGWDWIPENKGITWADPEGNHPVLCKLAKPPKPAEDDDPKIDYDAAVPGTPWAGVRPWVHLRTEPVDESTFTGKGGIKFMEKAAVVYPSRQVIAEGPSCVQLYGPDDQGKCATVCGRGRSFTVQGKSPRNRERVRSTARRTHAPCFPIKTIQDTVLEAQSINFVQIPRVAGLAMLEPMPTDVPNHCMVIPAVYDRTDRVAVINMHDEALGIPKDTEIGFCVPLQRLREEVECDAEGGIDPLDQGLTKGVSNLNDGEEMTKALADPEELFKDLKLEETPMLQKNPKLMKRVKDLIVEYRDIFSCPDQLIGKTNLCEFAIELEPNAQPHKAKLRPLNPKQKESLREQLAKWQQGPKEDWIAEECESPWAAALVPVQKKNGETRWAVDYRPLNAVTVKDSYPLPNIQENLEKLQGSKIFSTLDAAGAYHTIPVAEATKPLLAFTTPFGLFTFNRMPFGATNAGQVYVRMMEMLVNKLKSPYTLAYVDDLIAHTPSVELHLDELRRVFQMHREAGIRLGAKKTTLFAEEANYLGYKVTPDGIQMQDKYVDRVLQWPKPETGKQLGSFLGFAGYYRSFIANFAWLTSEMSAKKKEKTVTWTETMDKKFATLKELFGKKPIRAYPRYGPEDEPFEVWPDFSAAALGFVIQQVQKGKRRLIAAGGRKTTQGESNYAPTKGELAAIVHALRKFEHLLRYRPFVIYTDHAALKWLKSMKNPRGIFFRWLQELSSYEFEIHHVPGKSTGAADGLSRSDHLPDPTPEEEAESLEYVGHIGDNLADEVVMPDEGILEAARWNRAGLKQAQEEDDVLCQVKRWVKGARPTKEEVRGLPQDAHCYYKQLDILDVDEGDVLIRRKAGKEPDQQFQQILIPENRKIRDEVFKWSHAHPSAGHFGVEATVARAQLKFYWPGMYGTLKTQVAGCETCLAKQQKVRTHATKHEPRRHGYPGEVLYVDLVGPMPRSHKDNLFICTMQDGFSKFVAAVMIPCKEAPVVANAVLEGWITKFGCPDRIHTDQGTEFKNKLWKDLMDRLQITKTETPPYNPQSNLVERFHRALNAIMRCYMDRGDRDWEAYIPMCCFAYNTKINSTTGVTPFEAWMGRPAKLPIDLVIPTPQRVYGDENEFIKETERRFHTMYTYMRNNSEAGFRRNAKLYSGNPDQFQEGDLCWVFSKRKVEGKPQKITDAWLGPYRVVGKPASCLLKVEPADVDGRAFTVHMSRVRRFRGALVGNKHRPPKEPLMGDEPDESAEEIGGPEQWMEPADALVVPVQVPVEPEEMRDVMGPPPAPPKKTTTKQKGTQATATQSNMGWRTSKRVRDQTGAEAGPEAIPGPSGKKPRPSQGEKRKGSTAQEGPNKQGRREGTPTPNPERPKRKWKELLTDESEDEPMEPDTPYDSDHSSDSDTMQAINKLEELTVCVPPGTKLPEKASPQAAGWDCRATQAVTLEPGRIAKVPIGLRLAIPKGWCGMLLSRSKLASEGITVEAGLLDSDFRGPVLCVLRNSGSTARRIQSGERICQLVFVPVPSINWTTVEDLDDTERGENGFGSTGDH